MNKVDTNICIILTDKNIFNYLLDYWRKEPQELVEKILNN